MIYRKLRVWLLSKELAVEIYQIASTLPNSEKFGLSSQMTRAAVSIASNIAEGASRSSIKEQVHFIEIAYGSLMELACQLEISSAVGLIDEKTTEQLLLKIQKLSVMLSNYKNTKNNLHQD